MIHKSGTTLVDLNGWEDRAGPKRAVQWQDGRSAKESARAWLAALPGIPGELTNLLLSNPESVP